MNWLQWSGSFMERAGPSLETLILLMMVDYPWRFIWFC